MSSTTYRPDIDGLRAIAVLAVIAFHAFPERLHGGFVGVDIFFVISGFLITGIIIQGLDKGTFSAADFYLRRVRRIFPALIAVLAATMALGWSVLVPSDYERLGRHIIGGGLFSSNIVLWKEANYFDASSDLKPLLHLWSLGVEEQFYLLWPALVFLIWKAKNRVAITCAILIASFMLNLWMVGEHQEAAFYLPMSRFWELLVGAVLAMSRPRVGGWGAGLGALLLLACAVFMPSGAYPGWHAAIPTVGTALIIAAGHGAWINQNLSRPALVYVGLISYPLYLWHWPLLSILRNATENPNSATRLAVVVVSFIAASLTYHFLERPLKNIRIEAVARSLAYGMALMIACGATLWAESGISGRWSQEQIALIDQTTAAANQFKDDYRTNTCLLDRTQEFNDFTEACTPTNAEAVLWGDSHAAHLYYGLRNAQVAQLTASLCPPILGYQSLERPHCQSINDHIFASLISPTTVILAAAWEQYESSFPLLEKTIAELESKGHKVILVGTTPSFKIQPARTLLSEGLSDYLPNSQLVNLRAAETGLSSIADRTRTMFISMLDRCDGDNCPVMQNNHLLYLDSDHLTRAGSVLYAGTIVRVMAKKLADQGQHLAR